MANQVMTFMLPEDELAFLRVLERANLEVYPRRVPPDWQTFRARADSIDRLPEEELYLVAVDFGAAEVDKVKRGKDKGFWRIDEVRSPVIFWERSRKNEEGELVAGQLWAELDITPQTGRRTAAADGFRTLFLELERWLKKTFRSSDPRGYLVGPEAARQAKQGLKLRENGHHGGLRTVHK